MEDLLCRFQTAVLSEGAEDTASSLCGATQRLLAEWGLPPSHNSWDARTHHITLLHAWQAAGTAIAAAPLSAIPAVCECIYSCVDKRLCTRVLRVFPVYSITAPEFERFAAGVALAARFASLLLQRYEHRSVSKAHGGGEHTPTSVDI